MIVKTNDGRSFNTMIHVVAIFVFLAVMLVYMNSSEYSEAGYAGYKWKANPTAYVGSLAGSSSSGVELQARQAIANINSSFSYIGSSRTIKINGGSANTGEKTISYYNGSYPQYKWLGKTWPYTYSNDSTKLYYCTIKLDTTKIVAQANKYGRNVANHYQMVACHETLHAVGLSHVTQTTCIMCADDTPYVTYGYYTMMPNDINWLNSVY